MSLLSPLLNLLDGWRDVFKQNRTFIRATRQAISTLCASGPQTISQSICFSGREQEDWSADYRIHSQRDWEESQLFEPVIQTALELSSGPILSVAIDDTRCKKTGTKIPTARWHRDPLSPPFHLNLLWGLRYLQASILLPFHASDSTTPARGVPVRFTEVPHLKKPSRFAKDEAWDEYRAESKTHNLSKFFISLAGGLRQQLDQNHASGKHLLLIGDGSFCNRTCFRHELQRTSLLARTRKDAKLCFQNSSGNKNQFYSTEKFTPEEVRQDDSIPWQHASIFHGGQFRDIRFKTFDRVLWQGGGGKRFLRLIVIAPLAYRTTKNGKKMYRMPSFLLCTNPDLPVLQLIQSYFDRWEIEVNFRDEKTVLGVGKAQVWSPASVRKQPAFLVASYALLLLAGYIAFGPSRSSDYLPHPKWRRKARRPSCLDLVHLLRREVQQNNEFQTDFEFNLAS